MIIIYGKLRQRLNKGKNFKSHPHETHFCYKLTFVFPKVRVSEQVSIRMLYSHLAMSTRNTSWFLSITVN